MSALPSIEKLHELFSLDPETGMLTRRVSTSSNALAVIFLILRSGF